MGTCSSGPQEFDAVQNPEENEDAGHADARKSSASSANSVSFPPISTEDIDNIEASYDVKENGGFKRLFHCVNESLKLWIQEVKFMQQSSKILWSGDFDMKATTAMVKEILLWNRKVTATNPRIGLLLRLTHTRRDAQDTLDEQFKDMQFLLQPDHMEKRWGEKVRSDVAQLQHMFDTYSQVQEEFERKIKEEHCNHAQCPFPNGMKCAKDLNKVQKTRRCIICHAE